MLCSLWGFFKSSNWTSSQTAFDPFYISTYNMFFTSMPVVAMGILDQDVAEKSALRYGQLYVPGIKEMFFNREKFAWSALQGLFASFVLVGMAIG